MSLKFLIVGRTASGKDFIANKLSEMGLSILKSYTTRPQRNKDDTNHIFITEEEFAKIQKDEISAYTEINNYKYFGKKEQVIKSDIYVIDFIGIKELIPKMPDKNFVILYIKPKSKELQKEHFIKRSGLDKRTAEKQFEERYIAENKQFKELDDILDSNNLGAISKSNFELHEIYNNYDEQSLGYIIDIVNRRIKTHKALTNLLNHVIENNLKYQNILELNNKNQIRVYINKQNPDKCITEYVDAEKFATALFSDSQLFRGFMIDLFEKGFSFY